MKLLNFRNVSSNFTAEVRFTCTKAEVETFIETAHELRPVVQCFEVTKEGMLVYINLSDRYTDFPEDCTAFNTNLNSLINVIEVHNTLE